MCVYMYACLYLHMCVGGCVHEHMSVHNICAHMLLCVHMYLCACIHMCMCECVSACLRIHESVIPESGSIFSNNLVLVFHIKNLKSNYEFCSYLSCKSVLVLYC